MVGQRGVDQEGHAHSRHGLKDTGGGIIVAIGAGDPGQEDDTGHDTGHRAGGGPFDQQAEPQSRQADHRQHRRQDPGRLQRAAQQQRGRAQHAAHRHADKAGDPLPEGLPQAALGADDAGDTGIQGPHVPQHSAQFLPVFQSKQGEYPVGQHDGHGGLDHTHADPGQRCFFHGFLPFQTSYKAGPLSGVSLERK